MALLFSSCVHSSMSFGNGIKGSGNLTTETRSANEDFKSIEVSYGIKVNVEQADVNLKIDSNESYNSTETPMVNVKMPVISGLRASSGSEIFSIGTLISNNINAKSSSGSSINIEVEADAITLESSSGSTIEARGKALKWQTR